MIKSGKLEAGCDKLEASEKLESSIGTLLNLGDCREKLGRNASAWAAFRKAEATAKRAGGEAKRLREAKKRADRLEPKLTKLVIQVDRPVTGLVVQRDDEAVDEAVWGSPVPVDPDRYTITATAPGHLPWKSEVVVDNKLKRKLVQVPVLARAPVVARAEPPPPPAPVVQPAPVESAPITSAAPPSQLVTTTRSGGTWSNTRRFSAVLAVAGAGVLGGGIYYGLRARDLEEQSDAICPLVTCTDVDGLRYNDDAQDAATRANIMYIAGGAALATAGVLWLVGAPGERTVIIPAVGAGQAGVSLSGSF